MKSSVVDRFSVADVNFDVYDDGGCVIESPTPGFLELSAETIRRISAKTPTPAPAKQIHVESTQAPTKPVKREAPTSTVTEKAVEAIVPETTEKVQRSIFKDRATGGMWLCEFKVLGEVRARHAYSSREWARKGTLNTAIGEGGRIS